MATSMSPIRPVGVTARATTAGHRRPEASKISRKGASAVSSSSSANWWAPLFGWSREPDYIGSEMGADVMSRSVPEPHRESRLTLRTRFTEEKARQLRKMTAETTTFHDVMYHSAIASRLASNYADGSRQ